MNKLPNGYHKSVPTETPCELKKCLRKAGKVGLYAYNKKNKVVWVCATCARGALNII